MFRTLTLLLLFSGLGVARAGDDEVGFQPKGYAPRTTLRDRSYGGSTYSPSPASQPAAAQPAPSKRWHWSLFSSGTPALAAKDLAGTQEIDGKAFKQEKQTTAVTIKADPSAVPENKPFDDTGKKLADSNYKAQKPTNGKNPLLKPRQGIKEP